MKKHLYFTVIIFLFSIFSFSQSTTILPGSGSFDNASSLSTLKLPTLNYDQIKTIQNPTEGMIVYDTDAHCIRQYNGTKWVCLTNTSNSGTFQAPGIVKTTTLATTMPFSNSNGMMVNSSDIFIDSGNNSYYVGNSAINNFVTQPCMQGSPTASGSRPNGYLRKYDASLALSWCFNLPGKLFGTGPYYTDPNFFSYIGSVVATSTEVYIAGNFNKTVTVNGTDYTADGVDAFIAKLDAANGQLLWFKKITTGVGDEGITDIALVAGSLYICGNFNSDITLDGTQTFTHNGGGDFFIAKFDSQGSLQSASAFGSNNADNIAAMTINGTNLYAVGTFTNNLQMNALNVTGESGKNLFVSLLSLSLSTEALTSINTAGEFNPYDIKVASSGAVFVSGSIQGQANFVGESFYNNGFLLQLNYSDLNKVRAFKLTTGKVAKIAYKSGNLYCVLHDLKGYSRFDGIPIINANNAIVLLNQIDPLQFNTYPFNIQWIANIGIPYEKDKIEYAVNIDVNSNGTVYVPYTFYYLSSMRVLGLKVGTYSE